MKIYILALFSFILSCNQAPEIKEWKLVVDKLNFPEGPVWDYNNSLYASNAHSNWIVKITNGSIDTFAVSDSNNFIKTNGMTLGPDNYIYVCEWGEGKIIKFDRNGRFHDVILEFKGEKFNRPNDIVFDNNGNFYFTDPKSYDKNIKDGRVFYHNISKNETLLAFEGLSFPNGIAISSDNKQIFINESAENRVLIFEIIRPGIISGMRVFAELPGGDPDGLAFDSSGNLYVPHFGGGKIYVLNSSGNIITQFKTPGKNPSNVEFGGNDLKTLYITEDETNSIYSTEINISGKDLRIW